MVMKHILLFEKFTDTFNKKELKFLRYSKELKNKLVSVEGLDEYDIPDEIKNIMSTWEVRNKSPYSDTFYNSTDIGWGHKPDGSYRVSDHWNFHTHDRWHCQTDKKIPNNTHVSLGRYDKESGRYIILISLQTNANKEKLSKNEIKLKHLKDPETIFRKKQFKDRINNKEVMINLTYNKKDYHGVVKKYTGSELRIESENGDRIFGENEMKVSKTDRLEFTDRQGNEIEDQIKFEGR